MIQIVPFIPLNTKDINEEQERLGYQAWIAQLSRVLDSSDATFANEFAENVALHEFVCDVLQSQIDDIPVDAHLTKLVFLLFVRAGQTIRSGNHLAASPLVSVDQLSTFAVVYSSSNVIAVQELFYSFLSGDSRLLGSFRNIVSFLMECVRQLATDHVKPTQESLERSYTLVRLLNAIVSATAKMHDVFEHSELENTLFDSYGRLSPVLEDVANDTTLGPYVYLIKLELVSTFNTLMDMLFFRRLGFFSGVDHEMLKKLSADVDFKEVDATVDEFSERLLSLIETSGLEQKRQAFTDAPLIMDWEIEYNIGEKIGMLNRTLLDGEDERMEFLRLSMEQVRGTNIGEKTWKEKIKRHKAEIMHVPAPAATVTSVDEATDVPDIVEKISEVQELFPDYGTGFIEACLKANSNQVETVIMQLLDNTLPPSVADLDRSMERQVTEYVPETSTEESVLKTRRNIFDNDEFDLFSRQPIDSNKIHLGKKNRGVTETLLNDSSFMAEQKKNVLERIYNMYEDEYDDTYDDVDNATGLEATEEGGDALDTVRAKKAPAVDPGIVYESELVHAFIDTPDIFARSSAARKSTKRAEMRKHTNMTDEQLEGWAIMFNRNPRKQRILDKYMLFDGQQTEVSAEVSSHQQQQSQSSKKQHSRPPRSASKEKAFREKNKARFGNHNRKKMHDKKLNKAGMGANQTTS
ncbi:uncharacterized protein BYT42DRAFT_552437 [Radiomyces spectabilis]|uniref:uncharacterized protein n=1 Tax=Radiomyces spectabilis TaxID=64574 RepID=UPI002220ACA9|nr:uncharacterized protein BYT42DRAFT_552437 [Radiomyces spectabilis]KAI8393846.1 hypothetical protein BYT42DRAFT_552437 [Radiomyces spectabilis]